MILKPASSVVRHLWSISKHIIEKRNAVDWYEDINQWLLKSAIIFNPDVQSSRFLPCLFYRARTSLRKERSFHISKDTFDTIEVQNDKQLCYV